MFVMLFPWTRATICSNSSDNTRTNELLIVIITIVVAIEAVAVFAIVTVVLFVLLVLSVLFVLFLLSPLWSAGTRFNFMGSHPTLLCGRSSRSGTPQCLPPTNLVRELLVDSQTDFVKPLCIGGSGPPKTQLMVFANRFHRSR